MSKVIQTRSDDSSQWIWSIRSSTIGSQPDGNINASRVYRLSILNHWGTLLQCDARIDNMYSPIAIAMAVAMVKYNNNMGDMCSYKKRNHSPSIPRIILEFMEIPMMMGSPSRYQIGTHPSKECPCGQGLTSNSVSEPLNDFTAKVGTGCISK